MANFLTTTNSICYHEKLAEGVDAFNDAKNGAYNYIGFSETALSFRPDLIDGSCVIIHRDLGEVIDSLKKQFNITETEIEHVEKSARLLETIRGLHVDFKDIDKRLQEIWYYCLPYPYDKQRAKELMNYDIQTTRSRNIELVGEKLCLG